MKKIFLLSFALALTLSVSCITVSALEATPTASTVLVNGQSVAFDAYEINGNNYFKLRDLAYTLNGTEKQFAVGWDGAADAISLTSGQPYTTVGGEMTGKGGGTKTPTPTSSKILLDGKEVSFTAYVIEGNNYFKLRDIGAAFNFGVNWDSARNTIVIDTSKGYTAEGTATPPPTSGEIDSKLIGSWNCFAQERSYVYQFNADGTFVQSMVFSGRTNLLMGKFTTSGGIVYLTDLILSYSLGDEGEEQEPMKDKNSEYNFGTNVELSKDYLEIRLFSTNDNNPDSNQLYKFYK